MARLLVVADELDALLIGIRNRAPSKSLQVMAAQTGQGAIELIRQWRPSVVILEAHLNNGSGMKAFEHLPFVACHAPVIIVTDCASADFAIEVVKRGAFDYLLKPVDIKQLLEVVQRALTVYPDYSELVGQEQAGLVELTETLLRAGAIDIYRHVCREMDRVVLPAVLRHVQGNQVKGSELLGISRTTLRAKLHALNLKQNQA